MPLRQQRPRTDRPLRLPPNPIQQPHEPIDQRLDRRPLEQIGIELHPPRPPRRRPRPDGHTSTRISNNDDVTGISNPPPTTDASGDDGESNNWNVTWNNGLRDRSRVGANSSTNFSNGTSACAYAPNATSRTRPTNSTNDGSPDTSTRNTNVFTKNPINPSNSPDPDQRSAPPPPPHPDHTTDPTPPPTPPTPP